MAEIDGTLGESRNSNNEPPIDSSAKTTEDSKKRKTVKPRSIVWEHFERCCIDLRFSRQSGINYLDHLPFFLQNCDTIIKLGVREFIGLLLREKRQLKSLKLYLKRKQLP
ncbi:uncharacterized protein [Primulina eburnea]|uniref:uncharacterized protein n=1 Tax=Primulina eburnea TaxID=1245227 RepID=UPI003C6CB3BF